MPIKRIFLLFSATLALYCQEAINNEGIIKLVKSGISEELILNVIRQRPGNYIVGANELVMLKDNGVSEKLIAAMLDKSKPEGAADATPKVALAAAASKSATIPGLGLFYKKNNEYFELITEVRETLRGRHGAAPGTASGAASAERVLAEGSVG